MKEMNREEFLQMVKANEDETWVAGPKLVGELDIHLPEDATVLSWLWIQDEATLAIVTGQHFLLVEIILQNSAGITTVELESVPVTRLRSIRTHSNGFADLDFANPVFAGVGYYNAYQDSTIRLEKSAGEEWPSNEVRHFLKTLASVRR